MINCKQLAEDLLRFRDGELGPEETEMLRKHLHLCPPCLNLSEGYDTVVEILERLKPVNLPPDFLSRMKRALEQGADEDTDTQPADSDDAS